MAKDESIKNIFIILHHNKQWMQSYFLKENMICYISFHWYLEILTVASHFNISCWYKCLLFDHTDAKLFLAVVMLQLSPSHHNMPKKGGKNKVKAIEEDSDLEVFPIMEILYEDMKTIIGAEEEFK